MKTQLVENPWTSANALSKRTRFNAHLCMVCTDLHDYAQIEQKCYSALKHTISKQNAGRWQDAQNQHLTNLLRRKTGY